MFRLFERKQAGREHLQDGYCIHGNYIGGCGIDWICPYCEDGIGEKEWRRHIKREAVLRLRQQRANKAIDIIIPLALKWRRCPGCKLTLKFIVRALRFYVMQRACVNALILDTISREDR